MVNKYIKENQLNNEQQKKYLSWKLITLVKSSCIEKNWQTKYILHYGYLKKHIQSYNIMLKGYSG